MINNGQIGIHFKSESENDRPHITDFIPLLFEIDTENIYFFSKTAK